MSALPERSPADFIRASRRRVMGISALAALTVSGVAIGFAIHTAGEARRWQGELRKSEEARSRREDELRAGLQLVNEEQAAVAKQLAAYQVVAAQQFPRTPPDRRLEVLLREIQAIADAAAKYQGRRKLDEEGIARIREKLQAAPSLVVEVGGVWPDQESLELAAKIRSAFTGGAFKLRDLAEYRGAPGGLAGVSIYSKHELNEVLGDAVAQIFSEIGQPAIQWVSEDIAGTDTPGQPQPELKIVVGRIAEAER